MQTKNSIAILASSAAMASLLALSATAQPPIGRDHGRGDHGREIWRGLTADFDLNEDGQITLDELGGAEATFGNFDRDGDGVLREGDFARQRGARRHGPRGGHTGAMIGGFVLRAADIDQNQIITSTEFDTFLESADANADGNLEREEIHAMLAAHHPEREHSGVRQPPAGMEPPALSVEDLRQVFANLDANSDGEVSAEELPPFRHRGKARLKSGRGRGGEYGGMGGPGRGGRAGALIAHKADADDDGEVPSAEWQAWTAELDGDGNGEIIEAEWSALFPGRGDHQRPEHFARVIRLFDGNDNEILETADFDLLFTQLDTDASGTLEAEELPRRRHRGPRGRGPRG